MLWIFVLVIDDTHLSQAIVNDISLWNKSLRIEFTNDDSLCCKFSSKQFINVSHEFYWSKDWKWDAYLLTIAFDCWWITYFIFTELNSINKIRNIFYNVMLF